MESDRLADPAGLPAEHTSQVLPEIQLEDSAREECKAEASAFKKRKVGDTEPPSAADTTQLPTERGGEALAAAPLSATVAEAVMGAATEGAIAGPPAAPPAAAAPKRQGSGRSSHALPAELRSLFNSSVHDVSRSQIAAAQAVS